MPTAVLYDIHGNLRALDAVLAEVETAGCEDVVCGGDVALFGPEPAEVVDRLRGLGGRLRALKGNTDRYLVTSVDPPPHAQWSIDAARWFADRLGSERLEWLDSLPARIDLPEHDAVAVHATLRNDEEILKVDTPEEEARPMVATAGAATLLVGHVHVQYRRRLGGLEVVNPGSVGLPYDGDRRAAWAVLDGSGVELRRTAYDADAAVAAVEAAASPVAALAARRLREAAS